MDPAGKGNSATKNLQNVFSKIFIGSGEGACKEYKGGLEVIGAGFGRTGTSSLKRALEILYDEKPCYHMTEVIGNDYVNFWIKMGSIEGCSDAEIRAHFSKYASTTDHPPCTHWRRLAEVYPEAKVILSIRDPESYYKSVTETIFNFNPGYPHMGYGVMIIQAVVPFWRRWSHMITICFANLFQRNYSKENVKKVFQEWNSSVIAQCPIQRLLVFDVKQGWGPLCKFLDKAVPDVPFPNLNDTAQMKMIINAMNVGGYVLAAVGVVSAVYVFKSVSRVIDSLK